MAFAFAEPTLKKPSDLNVENLLLYEDNHLLVLNKPGGVLVQGDASGDVSLLELAKAYLKKTYRKPGNVYLGLVHRLDRVTSGVVVFARTSKAASRLSKAFREKKIQKIYLALVHGIPPEKEGTLKDKLGWNSSQRRAFLTPAGKEASLYWQRKSSFQKRALLLLKPLTGRKHQIRIQLAARGHPIVGDFKYGSRQRIAGGRAICLHAWRLMLPHPTKKEILLLEAPLPDYWLEIFPPLAGNFFPKRFAF